MFLYKELGMRYRSNRNAVFSCKYHVVWCPKYRRKVLVDPIDRRLKEIVRGVVAEKKAELIEIEVMPDHVHLLVGCDPQFGIHQLVRLAKGRTSFSPRSEFPAPAARTTGFVDE
ncbi:hypothetical protein MAMC_00902 [Methylacidimicrobium cyclopophantes]|uniref:Transposase IS200-like domain-containing protein n=1 Tax=Methylacidimicrobium cyclopophantes TaxID=1041766 RepID=A0A5E6M9A0_9BACT|nr:hypothetical protein MAMC_00902 [Methylacidimicrobium cyclopophantes]